MHQNTEIFIDGIEIPIGQTLPDRFALSGLRHLDRLEPAGILSVSTGMRPPHIVTAGLMGAEGRP